MVFKTFEEIIEKNKCADVTPSRCVVAAAADAHTLEALKKAVDEGLATPVLVGDKAGIVKILADLNFTVADEDI